MIIHHSILWSPILKPKYEIMRWLYIQLYPHYVPTVHHHYIPLHPIISHYIPLYPIISHYIPLYPIILSIYIHAYIIRYPIEIPWKYHANPMLRRVPSGNQTWHLKIPCVYLMFLSKPPYTRYSITMFDYRRLYIYIYSSYREAKSWFSFTPSTQL